MKVRTEVEFIKKEGKEPSMTEPQFLIVKSAYSFKTQRVIIEIDGKEYEVGSANLILAIQNATNCI